MSELVKNGDILPVLPLKNMVLFPGIILPVTVSRPASIKLVTTSYQEKTPIAVCCQRVIETEEPKFEDLYNLGTAAMINNMFSLPDGSLAVLLEGVERVMLNELKDINPYILCDITVVPEIFPSKDDSQFIATASALQNMALKIIRNQEGMPQEASMAIRNINNPPTLINYLCVNFGLQIAEKQQLLSTEKLSDRALRLFELLSKESQLIDTKLSIQQKAKEDIDKQQREYFLQQQMHTIQKELGDTSEKTIEDFKKRAAEKRWSEKVKTIFDDELKKLERINSHSPEYSTQLNYLEVILSLPWDEITDDNFDIHNARKVLDKDHFGMEKVKERIVEYLSVLKMQHLRELQSNNDSLGQDVQPLKAPILCLYGPPGVGKTSLGKSIATALGRQYARISLGGLHDEAEIRGHRRTYIGAMPGRIIQNLQKVKSSNPVFMLDEIDKVTADYHGDPTSALLEVLDPEQNNSFHDNYLDIDYDLSKVLFIATANSLSDIPRPLLDRMELIEMTGYLQEEKVEIAKRHLLPEVLRQHGITNKDMQISDEVLNELIDKYTRESGVRELNRKLSALARKIVKYIALEENYSIQISKDDLVKYLGKPRYNRDIYENNYIGVVTGLAWTQVGGEILFIECSLSQSKAATLTLTGNLGDVMKESATLGLGYIKAHATDFGIDSNRFEKTAIHIHVPEGAVPKDGPSAGITLTTAMVSAFTGRKVRDRIAMTGEMTLRGKVLPVGGIQEKILAAKRAGINHIILCKDNKKDIDEIPEQYIKGLEFSFVNDIHEVIQLALE